MTFVLPFCSSAAVPGESGSEIAVVAELVSFSLVEMRINGAVLPDFQELLIADQGRVWIDLEPLVVFAEGLFRRDDHGRYVLALYAEKEPVMIDPDKGQLIIAQSPIDMPPSTLRVDQDRLFVEKQVLKQHFDLDVTLRRDEGFLEVSSGRPLPRDLRLLRERSWQRLGRIDGTLEKPVPTLDVPYHFAGGVLADVQIGSYYSRQTGDINSRISLNAASELLYLTNRLFVSASQDQIESLRWSAGREDPRGGLLGVAGLRSFSLGDVSGQSLPLVGSGGRGRGVRFQAAPVRLTDSFSSTAIEGDAPPEWDAELYVADQLRDFQRVGSDGRYRFNDIDILYGYNDIKVRLYGLTGEVVIVDHSEAVSPGIIPPGKIYAWGSVLESGKNVWPLNNQAQSRSGLVYSLRSDVGISDYLSLSLQTISLPGSGSEISDSGMYSRREYYHGGEIRTRLSRMASSLGLVYQHNTGGLAWYLNLGSSGGRFPLNLQVEAADADFSSDYIGEGSQALRQRIRLSTAFVFGQRKKFRIPVYLERVTTHGNSVIDTLSSIYGHQFGAYHLTHEIRFNRSRNDAGPWSALNGWYRGIVAYDINQYQLRSEYHAAISPGFASQQLNLQAIYRHNDRSNYNLGLSYSFEGSHGVSAGFSRDIGDRLVVSGGVSHSQSDTQINLRLSFAFAGDLNFGQHISSRQLATYGAVRLKVFDDDNYDGIQQQIENSINNLEVELNGRLLETRTNAEGEVLFWGLDPTSPYWIGLGSDQLATEFKTGVGSDVLIWPRPGRIMHLEVPVVEATYLSGGVYYESADGTLQQLGMADVQAVSPSGQVQFLTRALSDGFFSFERLYPGRWQLEATSSRLNMHGAELSVVKEFEIVPGQMDLSDVRLVFPYSYWNGKPVDESGRAAVKTSLQAQAGVVADLPEPPVNLIIIDSPSFEESPQEFLLRWAKAWSSQDLDLYLSFYVDDFIPAGGQHHRDWKAQRRERLTRPTSIFVDLDHFSTSLINDKVVAIEVVQKYRSDIYADLTRKRFLLQRDGSQWQILQERVIDTKQVNFTGR